MPSSFVVGGVHDSVALPAKAGEEERRKTVIRIGILAAIIFNIGFIITSPATKI